MASTRGVDDILAELLAVNEAAANETTAVAEEQLDASSLRLLTLVSEAETAPVALARREQQPDAAAVDLDHLLGDLLMSPAAAASEAAVSAAASSLATKSSAAAVSEGSANDLVDLLDGFEQQDSANVTSAAVVRGLLPQQQHQQEKDNPFATSVPVVLVSSNAASTYGSEQHQQLLHAQTVIEQTVPATASSSLRTSDLPAAAVPAAGTQSSAAAPAAAEGSSSDSDDDMLDMLHDMAEVLEVAEVAAAAPHTSQASAPLLTAAAAAAEEHSDTAVEVRVSEHRAQHSLLRGTTDSLGTNRGMGSSATSSLVDQQQSGGCVQQTGEPLISTNNAPPPAVLPPHEVALQQAWQYEETLFHGNLVQQDEKQQNQQQQQGNRQRLQPLPRLQQLLADAQQDWNPAGRPDASGTAMIGGAVLLKVETLAGLFAGAAGMGAAGRGSSSGTGLGGSGRGAGVDWQQVLGAALAPHGPLQVVSASGPYVAVGSAAGSALVFQLPTAQQTPATQQGSAAPHLQNPSHQQSHSPLPGGAAMWQLGEGLSDDAVTCLGFSVVLSGSDALWLAVGHESGAITVWELQKKGPRQVAAVAQHGSRLTLASFPPGRATSLLLSADIRGRLCLHTFSSLLLRTNVSSRVLVNGQYGALLGISHLAPFAMPVPALGDLGLSGGQNPGNGFLSQNPSSTGRLSPSSGLNPRGVGTPPLSPKLGGPAGGADEAAWKAFFEDGRWRVGDGVFCLLTPTHVYIARIKPSSTDVLMLFSIPQPAPGPQAAVPVTAWLPHNRKQNSAGVRVHVDSNRGSSSPSSSGGGTMVVPVAVLALGWGSRLVMFEVPLIGDHVAMGAALAPEAPATAATALAAAAGQLRRGSTTSFSTSRAAQKTQQNLEALNPTTAAQIAGYFPLSITGTWAGGAQQQNHSASSSSHLQRSGNDSSRGMESGSSSNRSTNELVLGPTEPLPILGAHWLDADALAVVCQQGYSSLLLVLGYSPASTGGHTSSGAQSRGRSAVIQVQEQVEWMDQPVDRQWAVSGGLAAWGVDCQGSVMGVGPRVYLLGQAGGVFCGRLMPWSERLKTLQDVQKFKLGMYYALRFQQAAQEQHTQQQLLQQQQQQQQQRRSSYTSSGEPAGVSAGSLAGSGGVKRGSVGGGLARSEGVGAEPQQIEQWVLSLMLGQATAAIREAASATADQLTHSIRPEQPGVQQPCVAVQAAAEVCICICLLLSRVDILFDRVYPLFARPGAAVAGAVGAFVEALEVAVLSDLLESLPPEVMQALVDYFAHVGQPERVEGCVLHLSITSLDLNQVIRLCESAGLFSALTFIYNHIGDYRKPLLDLLAAVAGAASFAEAHRYCCKLLVYLRCCFRGLKFPPGTGHLSSGPSGSLDSIKSTLLGSLLFINKADLISEWTQSGGRAAAAALEFAGTPRSHPGLFCRGLSDPHPALQLLLSVDVRAVVAVLSEMTGGWDAVETDLRAAAGKPAAELESVLVATQVVVNAIIALLEGGMFEQWNSTHSSSTSRSSGSCVAMSYITDLLAAGRVTVQPAFALKLLEYIVSQPGVAATAADNDACKSSSQSVNHASAEAGRDDLEQQFINIINVVGIGSRTSGGQVTQQQQLSTAAMNASQAQAALGLARQAGFDRATATIHHLQGHYHQAIAAYLGPATQQHDQQQPAETAVFKYVDRFLSSSSGSNTSKEFMAAVLQHVEQLIQLDAAATAALLLQHQPDYQLPVLISLQQQPELQFKFLRAAMQQAMLLQRVQQARTAADEDTGVLHTTTGVVRTNTATGAAAAEAAEKLLDKSEVADLYVRLLARFDPAAVMPFLQSHHNYNVAAAIKECAAAGVTDAEAFLHERLGDLDAALRLYLSGVRAANAALAAAVKAGDIPVLRLIPCWLSSSNGDIAPAAAANQEGEVRWGLGQFIKQLHAAGAAAAAAEVDRLREAAAVVAGSLLQQLVPAVDEHSSGSSLLPAASNASALLLGVALPQQSRQPAVVVSVDLHKGWMADLSPRLRLKGLGKSSTSSSSSLQRTWTATAAAAGRVGGEAMGASSIPNAAAAAAAAAAQPQMPCELLTAWQALQSALAFCQRNTTSTGSTAAGSNSSRGPDDVGNGKQLWFSLMDVYVSKLRSLQLNSAHTAANHGNHSRAQQQQRPQSDVSSVQQGHHGEAQTSSSLTECSGLLTSLSAAATGNLPLEALPPLLLEAAAAVAASVMHDLFRLLLDELVCVMADHLPLLDIVSRVLADHGSEHFGEFRSTLLGLFGSTAYESAIMTAANRLITGDAFAAVRRAYGLRKLARHAEQEQQHSADPEAADDSSSTQPASTAPGTSAAAVAAAAPVVTGLGTAVPSTSTALRTAQALGVLGRGVSAGPSAGPSSSSSSSSSGAWSRTQSDRDVIMGILGPGAMHLQLQPAGPAAGHLPGVAAEFRAAARAAQTTKRVFKGEIDLAVEVSMMHQQQQQQREYRQSEADHGNRKMVTGSGGPDVTLSYRHHHQQQQPIADHVSSPRESFDIDDLLSWSQDNIT